MRLLVAALAIALGLARPLESASQWRPEPPSQGRVQGLQSTRPQLDEGTTLRPVALSLVVPGAGQHVLGQRRKWAYFALEVAGWTLYIERRRAGGHYRDRYRDFAWENARVQGATRVDGDFDYYETLGDWMRSGAFDSDAVTAGLQPEADLDTYNGFVWDRAVRLFLAGGTGVPVTDPAYQSALAYYGQEAYDDEMLWDWSSDPGAQSEFSGLVEASDSRFGQATTVLGVVLANHLLSAGDAFVSSRGLPGATRLRVGPSDTPGAQWDVVLTVRAPR